MFFNILLMTPEGRKWANKQRDELIELMFDAERAGQTDEVLRLREMKEDLEDNIKKAYGLSGRTRKASDSDERIRKTVTRAVDRALDKIGKKEGDELAVYLDDHLEKGFVCSFRKDLKIDWKIFM